MAMPFGVKILLCIDALLLCFTAALAFYAAHMRHKLMRELRTHRREFYESLRGR